MSLNVQLHIGTTDMIAHVQEGMLIFPFLWSHKQELLYKLIIPMLLGVMDQLLVSQIQLESAQPTSQ